MFRTERIVEFQHCDPAGIVFYPRYFEWTNSVVEEWFAGPLALPFAELHLRRRKGVPTARLEAEFAAPSRLGDRLAFALEVARIGGASLNLRIRAERDGEERLRFASTLVFIDLATGRPEPWPDELRPRLARFAAEG